MGNRPSRFLLAARGRGGTGERRGFTPEPHQGFTLNPSLTAFHTVKKEKIVKKGFLPFGK